MKRVGILGLPQAGKSTLFEILRLASDAHATHQGREAICVVRVPDERVDRLSALYRPKKTTHAQIQFVDTVAAGHTTARAAARGPDLFAGVRNCDALVAVVRDFENAAAGLATASDPARDLRALEAELVLNDLVIVESRMERIEKELRVGKKQGEPEHRLLARCRAGLEAERPLRAERFAPEEEKILRGFQLLTLKPLVVVYNQDDRPGCTVPEATAGTVAMGLRADLEREIVSLPAEERPAFRRRWGWSRPACRS